MTWQKLIPVSLGCAFIVAGAIATAAPNTASATDVLDCGENNGNLCQKTCDEEWPDGSCRVMEYFYWPSK